MNRELDGQIAEEIYGWVLVPVSKDANGENGGEILAPYAPMPQEWYSLLPLVGKIPKAWNTPRYTSDLRLAVALCVKVGYDPQIKLSQALSLNPQDLCETALAIHRGKLIAKDA